MTSTPKLLAYSSLQFGMGHEIEVLAVLREVRARCPDVELLLVAGKPLRAPHLQPDDLSVIVLPPAERYGKSRGLRSAMLETIIGHYQPDLLYLEEEPAGYNGELLPALASLGSLPHPPRVVLTVRDILNDPANTRSYWRAWRHDMALVRYVDRVLVFGEASIFDPVVEYGWPASVAARTTMCGYYDLTGNRRPPTEVRDLIPPGDGPLVVATVGGGADGLPLLLATAAMLALPKMTGWRAVLVAGPMASPIAVGRLRNATHNLPDVVVEREVGDMPGLLEAADVVIAMAGFNTVCQVVALGKRAVVVPRRHNEQELRASLFAARGIFRTIPWPELEPVRLAAEARAALAGPGPEGHLEFKGLERAGAILATELGCGTTPFA